MGAVAEVENVGWKTSRKGNLWTTWGERVVTVFRQPTGRFAYCVADRGGPVFSSESWRTQRAARRAAETMMGAKE